MRSALMIAWMVVGTLAAQAAETRYLLFPGFVPEVARELTVDEVVFVDEGGALAAVPLERVAELATIVHHELGACGGFFDVTRRIARGESPSAIVWRHAMIDPTPVDSRFAFEVRGRADVAALVENADADRYWAFLTELEAFGNRSATNGNGAKVAERLQALARELGANVPGLHVWTVATDHFFANRQPSVVVTIPGVDASLPAVVLGAHMDTISTSFSNTQPGADDDGSGSALLLETLRVMGQTSARFSRTIHLVWYAAEEWGLIGSQDVVQHFKSNQMPVGAVLQFDMVGYNSVKDDKDMYLLTDYTDTGLTETLRQVALTYTSATVGTTECGYACSDHASWHEEGYAAAVPFEASFSNMNGRLHTPQDKMGVLDKEHAFRFVQLAIAFLGEYADLRSQAVN